MALVESITQGSKSFVIEQGVYHLLHDAMRCRGQKPLFAGDDYTFEFTLLQSDGETPEDLTGWTLKFTVKLAVTDADPGLVQKTATLADATNGRFDITLVNTDVPGPGRILGLYDIQGTDGSGAACTLVHGCIEFLPNVTQTVP